MWGQDVDGRFVTYGYRIIPTRVGTSLKPDRDNVEDEDHPHACGDKYTKENTLWNKTGSSPRVWGQVIEKLK